MKYVVISGGVVSGLGKGITSSSIGLLLKESGIRVTSIKIDPYLNTDAGTMSPYEHGEVYVLNDGSEVDLDLGNYERFLGTTLTGDHNITTGKVYQDVINRERRGDYLGKTVQVIPHITDCIQKWIARVARIPVDSSGETPEVCLIELGGTVGDIESMVFLEALRQFKFAVGSDNFCLIHVSLVPVVSAVGEPKTKPTQHGVRELMAAGLHPDIVVCRSTKPLNRNIVGKISLFCMVPASNVIAVHDVSNLYRVPLLLYQQKMADLVLRQLKINKLAVDNLEAWINLADRVDSAEHTVNIGIVGKYTGLSDSYLSVTKALKHACIAHRVKLNIVWIEAGQLESNKRKTIENKELYEKAWSSLHSVHGVLIPGGFGDRGVQGKIEAANYARTHKIPFLGICLGFQCAVIDYARSVLNLEKAHSQEFDHDTPYPVVINMPEISQTHMGGTMRLGQRKCDIQKDTLAEYLYESKQISERHRHRYEVNPDYVDKLTNGGLIFSGKDGIRMEIAELPSDVHPYFFATQFHPEFESRPLKPSPPFLGFINTILELNELN